MVYQPCTEQGTPLDSAIAEIDQISRKHGADKPYIDIVKTSLIYVRDRHSSGEITTLGASSELFNLYFRHQTRAQYLEPMAHIMRVVGDDLGWQLGEDPDELWDLYQQILERHS